MLWKKNSNEDGNYCRKNKVTQSQDFLSTKKKEGIVHQCGLGDLCISISPRCITRPRTATASHGTRVRGGPALALTQPCHETLGKSLPL